MFSFIWYLQQQQQQYEQKKPFSISHWFVWDGMHKFIVFFQVETKSTEYKMYGWNKRLENKQTHTLTQ